MYPYFSKLEKPTNFKVYLSRQGHDNNRDIQLRNVYISENDFMKFSSLFKRLKVIDEMIEGYKQQLQKKDISYEEWKLIEVKKDSYYEVKETKNQIKLSFLELIYLLNEYQKYIDLMTPIFPTVKTFLSDTKKQIKETQIYLKERNIIKVPPLNDGVELTWPNAWYITPTGYLYNSGIGHKQGNLRYSFYHDISSCLRKNVNISKLDNHSYMKDILNRGYITESEFKRYANLVYKVPTIVTPDVEQDRKRLKNIIKSNNRGFNETLYTNNWSHLERSYQQNLIDLVVGHLSAEMCLFQSFERLNPSKNKSEILKEMNDICKNDLADILVRYSGFNKIESTLNHTITTSSLNGIKEFKLYLDKGWDLQIIPGIVYDRKIDKLTEVNFDSCFIKPYLEKELENYKGKGKVLIKY